jgi:plastocyanin
MCFGEDAGDKRNGRSSRLTRCTPSNMEALMKPKVLLAVLCAALAVAGCGSSSNKSSSSASGAATATTPAAAPSSGSGAGGASSNLTLAADSSGQLKFDKSSLSAKAGKVTITMDNPSPVQHAIAIEGGGVSQSGSTVGMGGKSTVTASVKPGTYTFFCPVDGHRAAGMMGTLTVK